MGPVEDHFVGEDYCFKHFKQHRNVAKAIPSFELLEIPGLKVGAIV
jgi:hypothetical protein